jgi:hypothetical protein
LEVLRLENLGVEQSSEELGLVVHGHEGYGTTVSERFSKDVLFIQILTLQFPSLPSPALPKSNPTPISFVNPYVTHDHWRLEKSPVWTFTIVIVRATASNSFLGKKLLNKRTVHVGDQSYAKFIDDRIGW